MKNVHHGQKSCMSQLIISFKIPQTDRQVDCTCRINSEKLKSYTQSKIERLLDVESLKSIYWPNEPLNAE